ncbi:acyltransferase family protein, partial [Aminobacter niigataensis]
MGASHSNKLVALESLRGIAACVVVITHCTLAFYPQFVASLYNGMTPSAFQVYAGPWLILFNGAAAVLIFFVLSGFVLSRRYFLTGDASVLLASAIKRWPRLMGLVLVSTITSVTLLITLPDRT